MQRFGHICRSSTKIAEDWLVKLEEVLAKFEEFEPNCCEVWLNCRGSAKITEVCPKLQSFGQISRGLAKSAEAEPWTNKVSKNKGHGKNARDI